VVLSQFTKVLSIRLMEVAAETISKTQTAFIKGRNILEAVVILHELIHELKTKHQEGIILKLDFEKACDKVNWEFLKEVLVQKGFPGKRIDWIMKTVEGGKVCINVNNEQGEFSRTFKVLRQGGGPLSPLLFNLVGDALAAMLESAKLNGRIGGLVPHFIEGGITHLQYANDTIILIQDKEGIL
jgi:hypothetical protein